MGFRRPTDFRGMIWPPMRRGRLGGWDSMLCGVRCAWSLNFLFTARPWPPNGQHVGAQPARRSAQRLQRTNVLAVGGFVRIFEASVSSVFQSGSTWRWATGPTRCYTRANLPIRRRVTRPTVSGTWRWMLICTTYRKPPVTFGNRLWNGLLHAVTLVRLPAPAVSYRSGKGFAFHPAYF